MRTETLSVRRLASGETLGLAVHRFDGGRGPSAYLQASLHGSETQGNWVIAALLERLRTTEVLGTITLVPCANPYAQNHKLGEYTLGRFDPVGGENWNRAFLDLTSLADAVAPEWPRAKDELRARILAKLSEAPADPEPHSRFLARTLQRLAASHDFLLDLHCASLCETHAYVPAYAFASFTDLPCRHAIRIGPEFGGAMDEAFFAPWWRLGQRIEKGGGGFPPLPEGFTLELGHQDWSDAELAAQQAEGILHFLAKRGVVRGEFRAMRFPSRYGCDLKDLRTGYAPTGGFLRLRAKLGDVAEDGAPYCEILDGKTLERRTIPLPAGGVPLVFTNAASVHEGMELGKTLTKVFGCG